MEGASVRGGSQVRYFEVSERSTLTGGHPSEPTKMVDRQFYLELELIKKFDPGSAQRIEANAEAAAQRANN